MSERQRLLPVGASGRTHVSFHEAVIEHRNCADSDDSLSAWRGRWPPQLADGPPPTVLYLLSLQHRFAADGSERNWTSLRYGSAARAAFVQ